MLPMVQAEPVLFNCGGHPVDGVVTPPASLPPSLKSDSDVDELVDIFFDVDVAVNTFSRIESCDLQPGDTWRGMQGKMSVTAVKKIRKKSDNKPQSQLNKCHNEKRRRELENETINQLEELLGTCLAEVKQPDKNGIVREATRQIQEVLSRRRECPGECPLVRSPVQGGEVTSTQHLPLPPGLHYSELTTLIEALKHYTTSLGWVLLEVNSKGDIECVTENIKDLIFQDRTDLYKKPLNSILHAKDHGKLKPLLRNAQNFGWGTGDIDRFQVIRARFLVNNPNGSEGSGFVETVIHGAAVRGSAEEAGSVMCVIRRCEDASAALLPVDGGPPALAATPSEHIIFRLDNNLTVLTCDLSGVENCPNSSVSIVGSCYLELVESCDRNRIAAHLREAACYPEPPVVSEPFRLRLAGDRAWLRVTAQTRLFRAKPTSGETDFIMSTHSVLTDDDMEMMEARPPGGPLMPSVANGDAPERFMSPAEPQPFSLNDFDLDHFDQFQLAEMAEEAKERAEAGPSEPPPRAPEPPAEEPNRLRSLLSGVTTNNRILKDLLKQEDEEASSSETSAPHTPHTPAPASSPHHPRPAPAHHAHHAHPDVLIRLLNEKSDEDGDDNRRNSSENRAPSQSSALLSQLLSSSNGPSSNGRSHDSSDNYLERMAGVKRKYEEAKNAATNVKRATPENQQVTSSAVSACSSASSLSPNASNPGMSPLCQKNQILVSLLARQQTTPTTPLPLPNPILRYGPPRQPRPPPAPQQPQQPPTHHPQRISTLSTILTAHSRANSMNGGQGVVTSVAGEGQSHLQMVLQSGRGPYPPPLHYGTTAPLHVYKPAQSPHTPGGSSRTGENEIPNDQTLSDILDEVIDNMPDADRPAPDVNNVLIDLESRQMRPDYAGMKEKNAMINAITQSLMQCETATKSPVSSSPGPGAPPVYPVQSPGSCGMGNRSGMFSVRGEQAERGSRALIEQQRARLLQLQRSQQMLVSPEAAEQPQADLGSTINALVSATPPNVALTRTDYHHPMYHQSNQMGSNYGTNKITTSQQNPMLSRQLSASGPGYAHAGGSPAHPAAALHTPMTPQPPFHRAPRPQLVGGYYEEGAYCGEYPRRSLHHPHLGPPRDHHLPCAGNGSGAGVGHGASGTSEYVRNELRAVVGARSRPDHAPMQPQDMDPLMAFDIPPAEYYGGGLGGGGGR